MIESLVSLPFFHSMFFGIAAMVIVGGSWCVVGIVMGAAPKRGIEPSIVQLFSAACSAAASLVIMFCTTGIPKCPALVAFLTCGTYFIANCMNFVMLMIMSYAMQRGPNGVIWAIIQSALVFPFLGGVLFFNMPLSACRLAGILLILIALAFFGLLRGRDGQGKSGWKLPAFICLGICAIQQNLMTAPSYFEEAKAVPSIVRTLSSACGGLAAALIYNLWAMTPRRRAQLRKNLWNPVLWQYIAVMQFFGLFFGYTLFYPGMNVMAESGLGGMCYPLLVGSCIVSFSLVSVLWLKERLRPLLLAALVLCVGGLVLLCIPV